MLEAKNLHVIDGPLSRNKLAVLRDEKTPTPEFRRALRELALVMVAEGHAGHADTSTRIRTPLAETEVEEIAGPSACPRLRAGLGSSTAPGPAPRRDGRLHGPPTRRRDRRARSSTT